MSIGTYYAKRGTFANEARAKQLLSFDGFVLPIRITPTDIDVAIEINDTYFIFGEVKTKGNAVPYGQKLFLTRLLQSLYDNNKKALGFIAHHRVFNASNNIILKDCQVYEVWWRGKWIKTADRPAYELVTNWLQYSGYKIK
jgi:hypothetical protein